MLTPGSLSTASANDMVEVLPGVNMTFFFAFNLSLMQKTIINPWQWQDTRGFVQAVEVAHGTHTLYCAGQTATDAQGAAIGGDMAVQLASALDNVATVLAQAGYDWAQVVRINYFTISITEFFQHYRTVAISRLDAHGCRAASTLVEVRALAHPSYQVEIEVTAVQ